MYVYVKLGSHGAEPDIIVKRLTKSINKTNGINLPEIEIHPCSVINKYLASLA